MTKYEILGGNRWILTALHRPFGPDYRGEGLEG